jgi:hypothetical protein
MRQYLPANPGVEPSVGPNWWRILAEEPSVNRSIVALIWLGGILLTLLLYAAGPAHFINTALSGLNELQWVMGDAIAYVSAQAFDLVRAAAIALFVVFLVLGFVASQRGVGRGGGLVGLSVLFVVLVSIGGYDSRLCWFAALLVAAAGAISMTQRLLGPPIRGAWRAGPGRTDAETRSRF